MGEIHHVNGFGIVGGRRSPLRGRLYDPILIQLEGFEDVRWPVEFFALGPTSVQA